jgi:hypothetical protein
MPRYDKICDAYLEFKKQTSRKAAKPLDMAKLMFTFLEKREVQLHNKSLIGITKYQHFFIMCRIS